MKNRKDLSVFSAFLFFFLLFTACGGGNGGGGSDHSVRPTISISPTSATLRYGAEASFQVTSSGGQTSPKCSVTGPGSVTFGGNTAVYSVPKPTEKPTVFTATTSCSVSNSAGTATATANITLEYDTPIVQKVVTVSDHTTIFSPREGAMFIYIYCSGCYVGGTVNLGNKTSSAAVALGPENFLGPGKVQFLLGIGSSQYHPDWIVVSVASPADGHGGGTSEPAYAAFVGNQSTYAASSMEIFQLYQADPDTPDELGRPNGTVYKFNAATESFDGKFSVGGTPTGIAVDDLTGLVITGWRHGVGLWTDSGQPRGGLSDGNSNPVVGVGAKGGYICAAEDTVGLLFGLDISQTRYVRLGSLSGVGRVPWNVVMTKFGDHSACVAFDAEDDQLSVVKFPEMALWNFATVVGLTPMSQLQVPPDGGWQLAVFEPVYDSTTQTTTVTVGVLSQYDRVVVVLSLAADSLDNLTITELRRVQLDAASNPIRIAADNANGNLVVGFVNTDTAFTTFAKIAVSGGDPTDLASSTGRLISGFGVSADGAKLIACGQGSCEFLDNQ